MSAYKFYSAVTRTSHEKDRVAVRRARHASREAVFPAAGALDDPRSLRRPEGTTRVGSLPVIENGKLVGIVTDRDAVKALAITVPALKYVSETLW